LPFLVWLVVILTLIAAIGGQLFNYRIAGLGWFIPLLISILIIFQDPKKITFPLHIWLPWIGFVFFYLIFAEAENALQRSVIMLCPFIIGVAVSKSSIMEEELISFDRLFRYVAKIFFVIILFKTGIILTGKLPARTALAAEAMTGTIFCAYFAVNYVFENKKDLFWWPVFASIPYIALTRTGMIAAGLSLPLTFAPMKIIKRLLVSFLIILTAIPLFYTERLQQKMFYSGRGTIQQIHPDNPDFDTSGRSAMWEAMQDGISNRPYWGHGANASETYLKTMFGSITHPHNDWLRLLYDYGYFGTGIFALSLLIQLLHILKRAKTSEGLLKILFYTGGSTILSFALFMISDNIILYSAFFGNLQFTIIGLAYAAYAQKDNRNVKESRKYRIRW
jgi:O-antigen ligase